MTPIQIFELVAALVLGKLFCLIYDRFLNGIEGGSQLLHWLEHYHWAEILLLIAKKVPGSPFLWGLSSALVADEFFQRNPFALGKRHFRESFLIGLLLLVLIIVA